MGSVSESSKVEKSNSSFKYCCTICSCLRVHYEMKYALYYTFTVVSTDALIENPIK